MSYPKPIHWWVDNVLPLVYSEALSYMEIVGKITEYVNGLTTDMTTVKNQIEVIEAELEQIDPERIADLLEEMDALETLVGGFENRIEALESTMTTVGEKVSTLESDVDDLETLTGSLESRVQNFGDRLGEVEENTADFDERIATAENLASTASSNVAALGLRVDDAEAKVEDIEDILDNVVTSVGESEEWFTATRDYTSGELVYVGGTLYKVIANITSGDSLVIGNNISATTVSDEIVRLNGESSVIDAIEGRLDTAESDINNNSNEIIELKSAIFETEIIEVADDGDTSTSDAIGTTQRWFFPNAIPAGHKIDKIGFTIISTYTSNNTPIVIELFENSNGILSLKKTISEVIPTSEAGKYYEINCENYKSQKDTYISFGQGRSILSYTAKTGTMLYIADKSSETLNFSSLSSFTGKLNVDIICNVDLTRFSPKAVNIIEIGEGLDFEEIQYALDSVDDSPNNPYTFIIYPKKTPYNRFSMIRKLTESYPWSNAPIRYISMIGVDKYRCVIEDDTGDYSKPPAEILTNGIIKNLTFIASKTNQSASANKGAYAVHIDAEPVGNIGYNMRFEDCIFKSDQSAGVGIGLHNACHLTFNNCEFISTASEAYNPHTGYANLAYTGSFSCHSSTNANDTNQELSLLNCVGISKEVRSYNIVTNENCYMTIKAFGNTFWCEGTEQSNGYKGSYLLIYGANHGNNSTQLNAQ